MFIVTAFIIGSQGGRTELSVYAETAAVLVALFVALPAGAVAGGGGPAGGFIALFDGALVGSGGLAALCFVAGAA